MVVCELDNEVAGDVLGWKLPTWQALLLHRVLPSCGGLIVYLTLICFDIALIYLHRQNGDNGIAIFCIMLMVQPAVASLVFTLASPPPGLQTEQSALTINIEKNDIKWILIQFVNCIFFPVAAIGRYCHQIFWWVEAVCASRAEDKERTREAVSQARSPSPVELYLFLQAFIHSAPHVILNILDLMYRYNNPAYDKISVQGVSIVTSILRMASTATIYRRFEREKICGKKYPWISKIETDDANEIIEDTVDKSAEENVHEPILKKTSNVSQIDTTQTNSDNINSDLIQFSPQHQITSPWFYDNIDSDSGTSSGYLYPDMADGGSQRSLNSDNEYARPISIIDKVAPRRRDTLYTVEEVKITPPPLIPAPRPGSLAVWAEKIVENAESIPTWLSAPPRHKYVREVIPEEPDIPRRVPRSYIRGLEPQDVTAALVQFLGWYAFFVSRLLSIAAFINCVPVASIIVLFSHYQIILLLLIVPQASTVRRGFYIFLAFIYLFCLMEFKIRFRHVRVWHVFWIIVCTIETVVFTGLWFSLGNNLSDWWRIYVLQVIFYSLLLSYMCFLVYFVMLKPRETIVRINDKNNKYLKSIN